MSYLSEPVFWVLIAPVVVGIIETAGAAFARPFYRRSNLAFDRYVEMHPEDEVWASKALQPYVHQGLIWVMFLAAPILVGALVFFAARLALTGEPLPSVPSSGEPDSPQRASFTEELGKLAVPAMMLHAPFRTAWLFLWVIAAAIVSSPVLLVHRLTKRPSASDLTGVVISLFRDGFYGLYHPR